MSRRVVSLVCTAALMGGLLAAAQTGSALPLQQGKLAFRTDRSGNDEIFVSSADGSGQTHLTRAGSARDLDPAWSPDGKWIAFARHASPLGGTHIVVVHAAGWGTTRLTNLPTIDRQPAWSPDGTRIAFTRGTDE